MMRMTAPIWKKMFLIPQRNRTLATVATLLVLLLAASCGDTTEPQAVEVIKEVDPSSNRYAEQEAERYDCRRRLNHTSLANTGAKHTDPRCHCRGANHTGLANTGEYTDPRCHCSGAKHTGPVGTTDKRFRQSGYRGVG